MAGERIARLVDGGRLFDEEIEHLGSVARARSPTAVTSARQDEIRASERRLVVQAQRSAKWRANFLLDEKRRFDLARLEEIRVIAAFAQLHYNVEHRDDAAGLHRLACAASGERRIETTFALARPLALTFEGS